MFNSYEEKVTFCTSKENIEYCQPFLEMTEKMATFAEEHFGEYLQKINQKDECPKIEYSKKTTSISLPGGYYHPGINDLILSKVSRGVLTTKPKKDQEFVTYYFNNLDQIAFITQGSGRELFEVFTYDNNKSYSIAYKRNWMIEGGPYVLDYTTVTEYDKNHLPSKYMVLISRNIDEPINKEEKIRLVYKDSYELHVQELTYDENNRLAVGRVVEYINQLPSLISADGLSVDGLTNVIDENIYYFEHDKKGYIRSYVKKQCQLGHPVEETTKNKLKVKR